MSLGMASGYGFEKRPMLVPRDHVVFTERIDTSGLAEAFELVPKYRYYELAYGLARLISRVNVDYASHSATVGASTNIIDRLYKGVESSLDVAQQLAAKITAQDMYFTDEDTESRTEFHALMKAYDEVVASNTYVTLDTTGVEAYTDT